MTLPARQQQALDLIERTLVTEEPRLGSLFAVFTQLTLHEVMPGTVQFTNRVRRLGRRAMTIVVTLMSVAIMVMAMWLTPGAHACRMHRSVTPPGAAMSLTTGGCRPGPVKVVLKPAP